MDDLTTTIRAFNRRWTKVFGLLDRGPLETEHSLPEARVIYELAQRDRWERSDLRNELGIDASFLTRILRGLEQRGLIVTKPSPADGRRKTIALTDTGRAAYVDLDHRSTAQATSLVDGLHPVQHRALVQSMNAIDGLLGSSRERVVAVRGLLIGDLGWVIQRHGELYADEFGWNEEFEALVATIVADFARTSRDRAARERAWIAEVDGVRAGCVFCCERDEHTAQLRLLLVEPWARRLAIGRTLVDSCVEFARAAGYEGIVLWTNDVLVAARRIYQAAGFELEDEERHHSFGADLVGQHWALSLAAPQRPTH